jgi:hypothetical protein
MPQTRRHPPAPLWLGLVALLGVLGLSSPAPAQAKKPPANPPPGPKQNDNFYAILVFDTDSNLRQDLEADLADIKKRLEISFSGTPVRQKRLRLKVFQGQDVKQAAILSYIANLTSTPNDTIFFYYGGHGAVTDRGHALSLIGANPATLDEKYLQRSTLLAAIKKKDPKLTVVITDCCAEIKPRKAQTYDLEKKMKAIPPLASWDVVQNLFMQHAGVVDINSCSPGELAVGYAGFQGQYGGVFTRAFGELICAKVEELDTDKDKFVTWAEFLPKLKAKTAAGYQAVKEGFRDDENVRDLLKGQRSQDVWAISNLLPKELRLGVVVKTVGKQVHVTEVYPGSRAAKAGLRVGDVVLEVEVRLLDDRGKEVLERERVSTEEDFAVIVDRHDATKGPIVMRVSSGGKERTVQVQPAY